MELWREIGAPATLATLGALGFIRFPFLDFLIHEQIIFQTDPESINSKNKKIKYKQSGCTNKQTPRVVCRRVQCRDHRSLSEL